jgi:hypothetical protein
MGRRTPDFAGSVKAVTGAGAFRHVHHCERCEYMSCLQVLYINLLTDAGLCVHCFLRVVREGVLSTVAEA